MTQDSGRESHKEFPLLIGGGKKAQKFSPPAAGETPHPCHLSGPEMISYTFRHHTPSDTKHLGLPGGAAGAMDTLPNSTTFGDCKLYVTYSFLCNIFFPTKGHTLPNSTTFGVLRRLL